jgi:hypothetical protein
MQFQIFNFFLLINISILKYFKVQYKIFLISFLILFLRFMDFFISLSTFNWRQSPKSLSSAETDLLESTTVWAGVTTKKLILDIFSIRPNCQPRVSRSSRHTQVILQTVTLFYIHCVIQALFKANNITSENNQQ